ncbi:MAG TPA: sulfite exporter TauE/SafE family protein [Gemmatimonadaceae bacterium]|nr:sulfite exporter TauE/SafE family protein [Gemmatimonadaceae bacterium]
MTAIVAVAWLLVSIIGGVTAAIAGFGIGSILTPILGTRYSIADAILAVSIPHAVATAFRCWRLRRSIRTDLLRGFGIASAAGGLAGAFLLLRYQSSAALVLAILLIATGIGGLTKWNQRIEPGRMASRILGALSGLFGGMAGNQGGLRAAALMTYSLTPAQFVATSTAVGLMVDAGRLPVYLAKSDGRMMTLAIPIAIATAGVLLGTILGERVLFSLSRDRFRQVISVLILSLGAWLLLRQLA